MNDSRILVAVSFGPQADAALKYGRKIAGAMNSMISCFYVVEEPGFITRSFISKEMQQKIRRKAEKELASKVHAIYGQDNISFEITVTTGKVYQKILEKAAEINATMIVMGRSDAIDLNKEELGINSSLVMARSDVPVCSAKNSAQILNNTALLPLDLTRSISLKITKTIELAQLFQWRIQLCTILPTGMKGKENPFKNRLREIQQLMTDHHLPTTIQLVFSDLSVPEEIVSLAEKEKVGQIIMMTQQEDAEGEPFIGSTTRGVLHRSGMTVFSLTPDIPTNLYPVKTQSAVIDHPIIVH
jgi:nucleotide-binding universal stress UspA family protein